MNWSEFCEENAKKYGCKIVRNAKAYWDGDTIVVVEPEDDRDSFGARPYSVNTEHNRRLNARERRR